MADPKQSDETFLDLPEEGESEELESQVQKAQEQLLQLKRQQDLIEKQKRELEELGRRQAELEEGRTEMMQNFSRALTALEKETYETEKRLEQLEATRENFTQHFRLLEGINLRHLSNQELPELLTKALNSVSEARADYNRYRVRVNADSEEDVLDPGLDEELDGMVVGGQDFKFWLKAGLAFTLPLILTLLLLMALLLTRGT